MSKQEKKVILFIVEGPSDEAAIGSIMKNYFADNTVEFQIVYGDITTNQYVTIENIIAKIKEQIDIIKERYRYSYSDFKQIIHLTDTDGVFIDDKYVLEKEPDDNISNKIMYYETHMETNNINSTIMRNHKKSEILRKLISTNKIANIPYKIYFNSCNLEHALYGKLYNFTNEEKEYMADDFAEKYKDNIDDFIKLITENNVAIDGNYKQTWQFIQEELNSLNRHSNMNLLFNNDNVKQ